MLTSLKLWKIGARRISEHELNKLAAMDKIRLIEVLPSKRDRPMFSEISNFLLPIHKALLHKRTLLKPSFGGFEVWFNENRVGFYFFASKSEILEELISQVNALYPNAIFRKPARRFVSLNTGEWVCGGWVYLTNPLLEIKPLSSFAYDPLSHLIEAMEEKAMLQIIFQAHRTSNELREIFEMGKLAAICFKVLIRLVVISTNPFKARNALECIANSFSALNSLAWFKPKLIGFPLFTSSFCILKEVVKRKFPRFLSRERNKIFILSFDELATLVHLPIGLETPKVDYTIARQLAVPPRRANGISIGQVKFRGKPIEPVEMRIDDLTRHVYVVGASGTGKTSLLINLISQAQRSGFCVHVIDPHGDMAYDLVESLADRLDSIVLLDPLKVRFSINPFELPPYSSLHEREMLIEKVIGQMVELMKRIFGRRYWGPSLNRTFQNVIRILYMGSDSITFEDMFNVLIGRSEKLGKVAETPEYKEFEKELKQIPQERLDAVLNKVDPFVKNVMLREIFCQRKSSVNFDELLVPGKVVVWRLAKAELTEQNMQMIGSAIITKFWFHCASREREKRNPILLVIDEFQNFAFLETLRVMITEARKFGVGLVLSHQHTKQLPMGTLSEVLGNTATKIIFRVSGEDAQILSRSIGTGLERGLSSVLVNLPDGSAIVKLRAKFREPPLEPFEIFTPKPLPKRPVDFERAYELMRKKYGAPPTPTPPRIQPTPQIIEEELANILEAVERVGNEGLRVLSKELGMNPSKLKKKLETAEDLGLIETQKVRTVRRPKIVVKLTAKGRKAIGKFLGRAGSLLHRRMLERAASYFELLGYEVEIPAQGGRKEQPDLIVRTREGDIAVEIETRADHPEQLRRNYEKNLAYGRVIFLVPSDEVGARVKRILGEIEVYKI